LYNLLGIDLEEWYHPELIRRTIEIKNKEPRVTKGIDKILDWLRKSDVYATFFIVGELLEKNPELIDKISENGHEIAFHSMYHDRLDVNNKEDFENEIKKFNELTKKKILGFRAPTLSLNYSSAWAIDVLTENNYQYDSSIIPVKTPLYGIDNADKKPYRITSKNLETDDPDGKLLEFPLLTTTFFGKRIPAAGGFYLRFLPMTIIKRAIKNNIKKNIPSSFYIHSWELTPEFMPKLNLPFKDSFITYHNLKNAFSRMDELIKEFTFTSFSRYLSSLKNN